MDFQGMSSSKLDKISNISDVQHFKAHSENQLYLVHS
jgi:hypothetical protein